MALRVRQEHKDRVVPFDPNPLYACQVVYDEETKIGYVKHWVAFDPKSGPDSEAQIEYHRKMGTDTRNWEVGRPCPNYR